MMRVTNSPSILSHVEKRALRTIKSLLSWVPDYNAYRRGYQLHWGGREGMLPLLNSHSLFFDASKNLPLSLGTAQVSNGKLCLQGLYYDMISTCFPFRFANYLDFEPIIDIIEDLPRGVVWRTFLADERIFDLNSDSVYMNPQQPCRATAIDEHNLALYTSDLLAEAVAASIFEGFLDKLLAKHGSDSLKAALRVAYIKYRIVDCMAIPVQVQRFIHMHLEDYFPGRSTFMHKTARAVKTRMYDRDVLTTTRRRFGAARSQIQSGDEVWVLAGAKVPYVLRPEKDGLYSFVGEAYMHGIMNGELVEEKSGEVRDIILV